MNFEIGNNKYGPFINNEYIELSDEDIKIAKKLTNELMKLGELTRFNIEFIMIEHHDGVLKFGEKGNLAVGSRSKASSRIITWCNSLYTKSEISTQICSFIAYCKDEKLPIII